MPTNNSITEIITTTDMVMDMDKITNKDLLNSMQDKVINLQLDKNLQWETNLL